MIYAILLILVISQAVSFYFIFNKIKPIIEPKGILLKPIPDSIKYRDVDPKFNLIKDVLESIKLEEWNVIVKPDITWNSKSYDVTISSHAGDVNLRSKIRIGALVDNVPYLAAFHISTTGINSSSISIDKDKDSIVPDIIEFLWEYIIKYHDDENNQSIGRYREAIDEITSKLKALSRSRKLNQIL